MLITILGLWLWFSNRGADSALRPADAPAWARFRDHLLEGPDAGAWASNAAAIALGRSQDLDPHRLPALPYLTAAAMQVTPDVALAGHLVNHLAHLLLGPVVYLLGRRWMSRGMAFGAAIAAVIYAPGMHAADRYGVDPLVTLALPVALLAGELGARRWWLAPVAGMLAAFAGVSHLTTIGVPVTAALLCLFRGGAGWRRWLGALGFCGGLFLGVGAAFSHYPSLGWQILTETLAEGVAPVGGGQAGAPGLLASTTKALAVVRAGGPHALEQAVAFLAATARPRWVPWYPSLLLPWLGVLGLGLSERFQPRAGWFSRVALARLAPLRGLAAGLPLAASLVPILAFAAAGSPPRYTDNFYPLGALLVFRGGDVLVRAGERLLARLPRWPAGALGVAVGLAAAAGLWDRARVFEPLGRPPGFDDVADWRLGSALRAHFPPGGGASCTRREVVAYAGRVFCPFSNGVAFGGADPVRAWLSAECNGEGPIPYVVIEAHNDDRSSSRKELDAWVAAHGEAVDEVHDALFDARIYAVTRLPK